MDTRILFLLLTTAETLTPVAYVRMDTTCSPNNRLSFVCSTSSPADYTKWLRKQKGGLETTEIIQEFDGTNCQGTSPGYLECSCNSTFYACSILNVNDDTDGETWYCSSSISGFIRESNSYTISFRCTNETKSEEPKDEWVARDIALISVLVPIGVAIVIIVCFIVRYKELKRCNERDRQTNETLRCENEDDRCRNETGMYKCDETWNIIERTFEIVNRTHTIIKKTQDMEQRIKTIFLRWSTNENRKHFDEMDMYTNELVRFTGEMHRNEEAMHRFNKTFDVCVAIDENAHLKKQQFAQLKREINDECIKRNVSPWKKITTTSDQELNLNLDRSTGWVKIKYSEDDRKKNELIRQENETIRNNNETIRQKNEKKRNKQKKDRLKQEENRRNNEKAMQIKNEEVRGKTNQEKKLKEDEEISENNGNMYTIHVYKMALKSESNTDPRLDKTRRQAQKSEKEEKRKKKKSN